MIICSDPVHGARIATAAGCSFDPAVDQVIAREENGELLGGVVYKDFTRESIAMHVAGFDPRWINKEMLWKAFDYPFVQLGCKTVFGPVPSYNTQALEFDRKLGFSQVAIVPGVFPGGDLVVLAMKREDCRWLKPRHKSAE